MKIYVVVIVTIEHLLKDLNVLKVTDCKPLIICKKVMKQPTDVEPVDDEHAYEKPKLSQEPA